MVFELIWIKTHEPYHEVDYPIPGFCIRKKILLFFKTLSFLYKKDFFIPKHSSTITPLCFNFLSRKAHYPENSICKSCNNWNKRIWWKAKWEGDLELEGYRQLLLQGINIGCWVRMLQRSELIWWRSSLLPFALSLKILLVSTRSVFFFTTPFNFVIDFSFVVGIKFEVLRKSWFLILGCW